jgi:hypothetical protein
MLSDLALIPNLFPHLDETTKWLQQSKRFRKDLYGNDQQTRKHARAVASLLGHSGPKVSCEHYIHCIDWLLPHFLEQSKFLGSGDAHQLEILSGRTKGVIYSRKKKIASSLASSKFAPVESLSVSLFKDRFPDRVKLFETLSPSAKSLKPVEAKGPSILDHWELIYLCKTTKESPHNIGDRIGFESSQVDVILNRFRKIQKIEEARGKKTLRHSKQLGLPDDDNISNPVIEKWRPSSQDVDLFISDLEQPLAMLATEEYVFTVQNLSYYVNNIWATEDILPFRNPAKPSNARKYIRFLHALGYDGARGPIHYISFHKQPQSRAGRAWKNALNFTDAQ